MQPIIVTAFPGGKKIFGVKANLVTDKNTITVTSIKNKSVLFKSSLSDLRITVPGEATNQMDMSTGNLAASKVRTLLQSKDNHLSVVFGSNMPFVLTVVALIAVAIGLWWFILDRKNAILLFFILLPLTIAIRSGFSKKEQSAFNKSGIKQQTASKLSAINVAGANPVNDLIIPDSLLKEQKVTHNKVGKWLIAPTMVIVTITFFVLMFISIEPLIASLFASVDVGIRFFILIIVAVAIIYMPIKIFIRALRALKYSPAIQISQMMKADGVTEANKEAKLPEYVAHIEKNQKRHVFKVFQAMGALLVIIFVLFMISESGVRVNKEVAKDTTDKFVAALVGNNVDTAKNMLCNDAKTKTKNSDIRSLIRRELFGEAIYNISDYSYRYTYMANSRTQLYTYSNDKFQSAVMVIAIERNAFAEHCVAGVFSIDVGNLDARYGVEIGNTYFINTYDPYTNEWRRHAAFP